MVRPMIEPVALTRQLRDRFGVAEPLLRQVATALRGGSRLDDALAAAGLRAEQIAVIMREQPEARDADDSEDDAADHTVAEGDASHVTTVTNEPSVDDLIARLVDMTPRFELQGEIARGAMGRILAAWDLHLGRPVAVKILRKTGARDLDRVRFLEEAQVTGQLQHPSIMPVYELGRLRDQVAFVMRRVEGRSLKAIISALRKGDLDTRAQFGRMRILTVFHQLCMAVAFAHTRGVVHRDLKPSNVMVGDFGEVVLLDWGLCKIVGQATRSTRSTSERWKTVHGQIIGTPAYMAPEQAMGLIDQVDARTDVYGLGAILYHLLTLRPPFSGKSNREIVNRVLKEEVVAPRQRAPSEEIPEGVEAIVLRCMARDPNGRFANARALADGIGEFLEGTTPGGPTTRDVGPLVREGVGAITRHQTLLEDAALVADALNTARASFGPAEPPSVKAPAWDAEARLRALQIEVADAYAQAVNALSRAAALSPDNAEARRLLCDLFLGRHDTAMSRGDRARAAYYRRMIASVDDGRYDDVVNDQGSLHVDIAPRGANVWLWRYLERHRRLVPADERDMGPAPIKVDQLPAGVYRLTARAADCEDLTTTLVIHPGRCTRLRLRMLRANAIPGGLVHVPAGTYRSGNPRDRYTPPAEQALPDYLIGVHPVTCGQYLEFLQQLSARDPLEARSRLPRTHDGRGPAWPMNPNGAVRLPTAQDDAGAIAAEMPVVGVTAADAQAYCQWLAQLSQRPVRLPTDQEWEKAARGTEGRTFPWGDLWEPAYAAGPETWPGPWPPGVGHVTEDVSPFGAGDFAGGVREWTSTIEPGGVPRVVVRGGSFLAGDSDGRPLWAKDFIPGERVAPDIGFRIASDV